MSILIYCLRSPVLVGQQENLLSAPDRHKPGLQHSHSNKLAVREDKSPTNDRLSQRNDPKTPPHDRKTPPPHDRKTPPYESTTPPPHDDRKMRPQMTDKSDDRPCLARQNTHCKSSPEELMVESRSRGATPQQENRLPRMPAGQEKTTDNQLRMFDREAAETDRREGSSVDISGLRKQLEL